jgi:hypothetical protein
MRVDAIEFTRLDQRGDDRPVGAALVATCKQRVFAVECDGADRPFDGVAVNLDAAVVERADPVECLAGDGGVAALGDVVEAPTQMCPTIGSTGHRRGPRPVPVHVDCAPPGSHFTWAGGTIEA